MSKAGDFTAEFGKNLGIQEEEKMQRETFRLNNMIVHSGKKKDGYLELADGKFQIPVTIFHGEQSGKTVLVTAGIHAGEYVGIQAVIELSQKLKIEKVAGTVILMKAVNRQSFEHRGGSMGWEDKKNLNRVFPGDENGTQTEQLAWAISQEVYPVIDYYIDVHSGDEYESLTPYVYYAGKASADVVHLSREMAKQVDVPYMVRSDMISGGAYNCAASSGIPAVLIERGGMGQWTVEEVHSTRRDVRSILCHLGVYTGQRDYRKYYPLDVEDVCYQHASCSGCWYPQKNVGNLIRKGEILGKVKDYEGTTKEVCTAEYDGVILYQTSSLQVVEDGPMICYGRIAKEGDDRKERITKYWGKRSDSFLEQRRAELKSPLAMRWLKEIAAQIPENRKLKILDVGCGSGFFTILLSHQGHNVTGTDLTPEMIHHAALLAEEEKTPCTFYIMDAENLDFPDETFDVVISRNLTWTLPDAEKAYKEWTRVLKKGGILLNFDANYGNSNFTDTSQLPKGHAHNKVGDEMMQECEEIKRQLPISSFVRPAWDLETLGKLNVKQFVIDLGISSRIYLEKDEFYNPVPMFMIRADKK